MTKVKISHLYELEDENEQLYRDNARIEKQLGSVQFIEKGSLIGLKSGSNGLNSGSIRLNSGSIRAQLGSIRAQSGSSRAALDWFNGPGLVKRP